MVSNKKKIVTMPVHTALLDGKMLHPVRCCVNLMLILMLKPTFQEGMHALPM